MNKIIFLTTFLSLASVLGKMESDYLYSITFRDEQEEFIKEMYARIESNKEKIAQLREELKKNKGRTGKLTEKELRELELRNKKLKRKVDKYSGKPDWKEFKKECDDEMNSLDEAVTDAI